MSTELKSWTPEAGRGSSIELRSPGMRTVAGSILTSGNILSWGLVMK